MSELSSEDEMLLEQIRENTRTLRTMTEMLKVVVADWKRYAEKLVSERDAARATLAEALEKHERELYAAHERGWNDRDALLKVRMNDDD